MKINEKNFSLSEFVAFFNKLFFLVTQKSQRCHGNQFIFKTTLNKSQFLFSIIRRFIF